jgi:hypothetical protein
MKRKLLKPIYECRCYGRLQTKRFTRLVHTRSVVELEHRRIFFFWKVYYESMKDCCLLWIEKERANNICCLLWNDEAKGNIKPKPKPSPRRRRPSPQVVKKTLRWRSGICHGYVSRAEILEQSDRLFFFLSSNKKNRQILLHVVGDKSAVYSRTFKTTIIKDQSIEGRKVGIPREARCSANVSSVWVSRLVPGAFVSQASNLPFELAGPRRRSQVIVLLVQSCGWDV